MKRWIVRAAGALLFLVCPVRVFADQYIPPEEWPVHESRDGRYQVKEGPPGPSSLDDLAFSFYDRGELLSAYRVGHFVNNPESLPHSMGGRFFWIRDIKLRSWSKKLVVTSKEGIVYRFDITTGEMLESRWYEVWVQDHLRLIVSIGLILLLVGVVSLGLMVIVYTIHVIRNSALSGLAKCGWICAIWLLAVFAVPAYWLKHRRHVRQEKRAANPPVAHTTA